MNKDITPNKVSVLIPAFNAGKFICEAISSALECLEKPEVIVVNDGSTDDTGQLLKAYKNNNNVKIFTFPDNRGKVAAFNQAYSAATGDIITMLSADDKMLPGRNVLSYAEVSHIAPQCFVGNLVECDENLNPIKSLIPQAVGWPKILEMNYLPGGAMAFNATFGAKVFPLPNVGSEDYFIALSACFLDCVEKIEEDFLMYRRHDGGTWKDIRLAEMIQKVALRNIHIISGFSERFLPDLTENDAFEFTQLTGVAIKYNKCLGNGWSFNNLIFTHQLPKHYNLKSRVRLALGAKCYARLLGLNGHQLHYHQP